MEATQKRFGSAFTDAEPTVKMEVAYTKTDALANFEDADANVDAKDEEDDSTHDGLKIENEDKNDAHLQEDLSMVVRQGASSQSGMVFSDLGFRAFLDLEETPRTINYPPLNHGPPSHR